METLVLLLAVSWFFTEINFTYNGIHVRKDSWDLSLTIRNE